MRRVRLFSAYAAAVSLCLALFDMLPRLIRGGLGTLLPKDYTNTGFTLVLFLFTIAVILTERRQSFSERFGNYAGAFFILLLLIQGNLLLALTTTIPMPEIYLILIFLGVAGGIPLPASLLHPLITVALVSGLILINLDGTGRTLPVLSSLILTASAALAMAIDLSNYRNLQGMISTRRELEEIRKRQDAFFALLAHDLRNPLGALPKLVELHFNELESSGQLTSARQEMLEALSSTTVHTVHLLEDLLEWGEYRAGQTINEKGAVILPDLVSGVLNSFSTLFHQKSLVVETSFAPVPPVFSGARQIQTSLRNILGNAVKFSNIGGKIKISLQMHPSKRIALSIIDEGTGMDRETLQRLKQGLSMRSQNGSLGETGTGLGMSLVYRLLLEIEAEMEIESVPGRGTSVSILLPLPPTQESAAPGPKSGSRSRS